MHIIKNEPPPPPQKNTEKGNLWLETILEDMKSCEIKEVFHNT